MNQCDGEPQRGGSFLVWLRLIARVFYPRTLQGVLALVIVASLLVQLVPQWLADVLSLAILVWFGRAIVIARGHRRQSGRRALGRALAKALGYVVAYFAFAFAVYAGTVFLAFLAGGGNGSGLNDPAWGNIYQGKLGTGEFATLVAIIGLLTWIPNRLFRIRLDMDGTAGVQRVLLWLITAVACANPTSTRTRTGTRSLSPVTAGRPP